MRIGTIFWLLSLFSVSLAVATGIGLTIAYQSHHEIMLRQDFAFRVNNGVFQLTALTSDYLQNPSPRAERQWRNRHASLAALIEKPAFWLPEKDESFLDFLRHQHKNSLLLFSLLVDAHQKVHNHKGFHHYHKGFHHSHSRTPLENVLGTQLQTTSQMMASKVAFFADRAQSALIRIHLLWTWLFGGMLIGLFALLFGVVVVLVWRIVRPIMVMRRGMERITAGDLGYRLNTGSQDEIGELSRDIDRMVGTVQDQQATEKAVRQTSDQVLSGDFSVEGISELLLKKARDLTASTFGYVGYIDPETGHLICPTMTRTIWNQCQVADKTIVFKTFGGLWGWVLNNRKPLFTNKPAEDPRSSSTPLGHIKIKSFLSVPALLNETLVGQISLANSQRPYSESDVNAIQQLADLFALALQRRRSEEALKQANDNLEQQVADRTADLDAANQGLKKAIHSLEQANERAEAANAAKSQFLANMSHEIRSPLNGVIGLTQLSLTTELTKQQQDYMTKIQYSSQLLLSIINDILDFSKIEAGRIELENHEFRLSNIIEQTATLFAEKADAKGLELVVWVDPEVPAYLLGDRLRLTQVINNLIDNALKFTDAGEVKFLVHLLEQAPDRAQLRFEVRDTGIGIAEEKLGQLFQPFVQADGSITRRYGGSGLGLIISKKLVKLMGGGEIEVDSIPGQGSVFSFACPFALPAGPVDRYLDDRRFSGGRQRVLVVDDQESARTAITEILHSWHYTTEDVDSGEAALRRIRQQAGLGQGYGLVLLDWKMSGMDGLETARQLRKLTHEGEISAMPTVIMVTAYAQDQVLGRSDGGEFDAFLSKPVTPLALINTLTELERGPEHDRRTEADRGGDFPASSVSVAPPSDIRAVKGRLGNARVLLVEDNPVNRQVGEEMLRYLGVECVMAENGREAVDRVTREAPDAVLMDLQMPEMDGFEASRLIRRTCPDLPIIALTAAAMVQDRQSCLDAGMNDHLPKPIDLQALATTLSRWLPSGEGTEPKPPVGVPIGAPAGVRAAVMDGRPLPDHLPGIDIQAGLTNAADSVELFHQLLHLFAKQFSASADRPQKLTSEDRKSALIFLHSLKGAAKTIGATAVAMESSSVESKLLAHDPVSDEALGTLARALGEVLDGLRKFHPPEREKVGERVSEEVRVLDRGSALEITDRLRRILERNEPVPPEMLTDLRQAGGEIMAKLDRARLLAAIACYDYDTSLALLEAFAETMRKQE